MTLVKVKHGEAVRIALQRQRKADPSAGWYGPNFRKASRGNWRKVTDAMDAQILRLYMEGYNASEISCRLLWPVNPATIREHISWYKIPGEMILDAERVDALLRRHPVVKA